jgi:hypothetical protein
MSLTCRTNDIVRSVSVVALLALGCGGTNPFRAVERAIERELPGRIGPAERYEARVSRSGANLVSGRIPWVEIRGVNLRTADGLQINDLRVRLEGVEFDRGSRSISAVAGSRFTAGIGAEAVTAFVRRRGPRLRDARVRFQGDGVVVNVAPAVLGIGVPVEIEGRPALRDAERIDFDASRVAVLRIGLPEIAIRRLEEAINPIVDFRGLKLPIRVTDVRVESGSVRVAGTTTFATGGSRG